jgi:alkylation response protein AidB-like acyl-CoA dehydrogenase
MRSTDHPRGDLQGASAAVVEAAASVASQFDEAYWREHCATGSEPVELWKELATADLLGLGLPESCGGVGGGVSEAAALVETLAACGRPLFSLITTYICGEVLLRHGSEAQRRQYLPAISAGELRLAFAITEPDAGTNSFAIRTSAQPADDGDLLLTGHKCYISGLDSADVVIVVARTAARADVEDRRDGMALLLVDPRASGVTMRQMDIVMPAPERQFDVWFDDVVVPADRVIGEPDAAFRYLFTVLNPERLLSAATQVGIGNRALELGVKRAGERAPFGVPIGSYQAIAHPLAHARAALDAARLMTYAGCRRYDDGGSAAAEANVAKLLAAEAAQEALDAAVQAHGGAAFDESSGLVSLWPLVRMGRIGPVSNEMILNHIAEHVLGLPKSY